MKKIDWYILKKFLTTFFFCVFLFTIIAVVIDVSEKTDDFVKSGLSFSQVFTQYYLGFIPLHRCFAFPAFCTDCSNFFHFKNGGTQRNNCHSCQWCYLFKNVILVLVWRYSAWFITAFFTHHLLYRKQMQNGDCLKQNI